MKSISATLTITDNVPGLPSSLTVPLFTDVVSDFLAGLTSVAISALGSLEVDVTVLLSGESLDITLKTVDVIAPELAALIPTESFAENIGVFGAAVFGMILPQGITAKGILSVTVSQVGTTNPAAS